jgi:hypothetical protein
MTQGLWQGYNETIHSITKKRKCADSTMDREDGRTAATGALAELRSTEIILYFERGKK